jgi:type I restriction enzyme, S subunit
MIPDGWEERTIGELINFSGGSQPPKNTFSFEPLDGYIRLIQIRDYKTDKYATYVPKRLAKKFCGSEDIMIGRYGPPIFQILRGISGAYNVALIKATPNKKLMREYMYYFLSQDCLQEFITGLSQRTSGQTGIEMDQLKSYPLPLPPLSEQCKIAEVLGAWDEAIDLLEKLVASNRSRKQGLMQQLLTGKKRFKEFEGSEYSIVKLSEVTKIRRGASPRPIQDPKWFAEKGRGWVRIRDVTASDTYLMETSQYLSDLAVEKSVAVDPGDLIMSICATIGVPRIVGIPACIHDGFVVFRGFEQQLDKLFLYHYINLISAKISDSGQPGTQKNINTTIVGNIEVPKFSLPEQEKIAAVLTAADEEIATLEKQLAAYKRQKIGLMQQLLTGRIRI